MNGFLLYLLVLLFPLLASANISSTYNKYKRVSNSRKMTGFEAARIILDENGLNNMYIVEVKGNLTDHYDPNQKVVRLSSDIYHGDSIASIAVAAHECGHAMQDKEGYTFLRIRSFLCPIVNGITYIAYIMLILSFILEMMDGVMIAAAMVFISLIFQVVTLPVEFNASSRALVKLEEYGIVSKNEKEDANNVLKAAALTYVAAVLSSVLNLIRLLMIESNRRR